MGKIKKNVNRGKRLWPIMCIWTRGSYMMEEGLITRCHHNVQFVLEQLPQLIGLVESNKNQKKKERKKRHIEKKMWSNKKFLL